MPQLLAHDRAAAEASPERSGPDQGVIKEARRRQRRRRMYAALGGALVAAAIATTAWALGGEAARTRAGHGVARAGARAVATRGPRPAAFDVRLVPTLAVGHAGWCVVIEEHGTTGGSACGGAPTTASPFLQEYGWGQAGSHRETEVAVTTPQVRAILVGGRHPVATLAVPGLPYGLRAMRVVVPLKRPYGPGPSLVALDGAGHPLAPGTPSDPGQATVRSWRGTRQPASGACRLHASGVPGLGERGGQLATAVIPFPGQLIGHAFVSCIDAEYQLQGMPIDAELLLDAAHPGARPATLPDWRPVRGAPGFFFEGGLTARRYGNAWLLARQGSGLAQRMRLLRHLTVSVRV